MASIKRKLRHIPLWMCWLVFALVFWLIMSGVGLALSGDTTLNASIGDISITADLPVTYTPQMDGEDYLYDEHGNLLYDETAVDAADAAGVVAWNFDGTAGTLNGEVSAKYESGCLAPEMDSVKDAKGCCCLRHIHGSLLR